MLALVSLAFTSQPAQPSTERPGPALAPAAACPPQLTARFAPADPDDRGTYRVCLSPQPLDDLRPPHWRIERLVAADAFAGAPADVRRTLGLLYGGQRLRVARGLLETDGFDPGHDRRTFESYTLIEPSPAESLDRTVPGTLMIITRVVRPAR